jgi:ankyrin repeat protein
MLSNILAKLIHFQELHSKEVLKTNILQFAAGRAEIYTVKILIDAGANVNQNPPSTGDIREPGPWTALYMTVDNENWRAKNEETYLEIARQLLENGADMNKNGKAGTQFDPETPLEAAQRLGRKKMLALFHEYM